MNREFEVLQDQMLDVSDQLVVVSQQLNGMAFLINSLMELIWELLDKIAEEKRRQSYDTNDALRMAYSIFRTKN